VAIREKGLIALDKDNVTEEQLLDVALEAGADDVKDEGSEFQVITSPSDFEAVKEAVDEAGFSYELAEITMIPKNTVRLEGKKAQQMVNLMQGLEDHEDVNHVYANFDIPDDVMEALS